MNRIRASSLTILLVAASLARAETADLSATVTAGYDSRYVLYGYTLSRHLYRGDVYLFKPLNEKISVWGGAWYGYLTDGTYQEVDVYAGIDRMLTDTLSVGLAYSLFNYLEVPFPTSDHVSEFAAHVTRATDRYSISLRNHYDTEADGSLLRGMVECYQPATEKLSFTLAAEIGYAFEYFIDGNLWNHALVTLKAPYQVNNSISAAPFIARSIALAAIDDFEDDLTYYGLSFSISF